MAQYVTIYNIVSNVANKSFFVAPMITSEEKVDYLEEKALVYRKGIKGAQISFHNTSYGEWEYTRKIWSTTS